MNTYHVEVTRLTEARETAYFKVEANSEEEAYEKLYSESISCRLLEDEKNFKGRTYVTYEVDFIEDCPAASLVELEEDVHF